MSFDAFLLVKPSQLVHRLNPFRTGRCLSTIGEEQGIPVVITSQSLSNRAMSFDRKGSKSQNSAIVSIPFEQGDVFRRKTEYIK